MRRSREVQLHSLAFTRKAFCSIAARTRSRCRIAAFAVQSVLQLRGERAAALIQSGTLERIARIAQQTVAHYLVMRVYLAGRENSGGAMASLVAGKILIASGYTDHAVRRGGQLIGRCGAGARHYRRG